MIKFGFVILVFLSLLFVGCVGVNQEDPSPEVSKVEVNTILTGQVEPQVEIESIEVEKFENKGYSEVRFNFEGENETVNTFFFTLDDSRIIEIISQEYSHTQEYVRSKDIL